uniref:Putative secreted protein n=1 Tax=Xenopsylla cheopis TaxID=163159 RepID=A0A6M2E1V5_XENCH
MVGLWSELRICFVVGCPAKCIPLVYHTIAVSGCGAISGGSIGMVEGTVAASAVDHSEQLLPIRVCTAAVPCRMLCIDVTSYRHSVAHSQQVGKVPFTELTTRDIG